MSFNLFLKHFFHVFIQFSNEVQFSVFQMSVVFFHRCLLWDIPKDPKNQASQEIPPHHEITSSRNTSQTATTESQLEELNSNNSRLIWRNLWRNVEKSIQENVPKLSLWKQSTFQCNHFLYTRLKYAIPQSSFVC